MKPPKPKKCRECKAEFMPRSTFQICCSIPCVLAIQKKKAIAKAVKEKRDWYSEHKSIAKERAEAKVIFQKWIRIRDAGNTCISCGTNNTVQWHAGHFKKSETYYGVIFDERNAHLQCKKCNVFLDGNELNYREGLVAKFGNKWVEQLEKYARETKDYAWSRTELIEIKKKYNDLIKKEK